MKNPFENKMKAWKKQHEQGTVSTTDNSTSPKSRFSRSKITASDDTAVPPLPQSGVHNTSFSNEPWYATEGRIGRVRYLAFNFIWGVLVLLVYLILGVIMGMLGMSPLSVTGLLLLILPLLPILYFAYGVLPKRRLNDIGKSGWWALLVLVPVVNLFYFLYIMIKSGDADSNEYGLPPAPYTTLEMVLAVLTVLGIFASALIPTDDLDAIASEEPDSSTQVQTAETTTVTTTTSSPEPAASSDTAVVASTPDAPEAVQPAVEQAAEIEQAITIEGTQGAGNTSHSVPMMEYDDFVNEAESTLYIEREDTRPAATQ